MKNKILSLVLVFAIVLSIVPVAFAMSHKESRLDNEVGNKDGACIQIITPAMNPETKECKEFSTPCEVPKGWKNVGSCQGMEKREEMKNKMKGKEMLKEKMKDMLMAVKSDKINMKDKAMRIRECKKENTEECKKKFKDFKGDAKNYYGNMLNVAENHINRLKEMLSENTALSDADAAKISGDIEIKLSEVAKLRSAVNGIIDTTTKEELRKVQDEIKKLMSEIKEFSQKITQMKTKMKFGGVLEKTKHLEERLDNILSKAKESGVDTAKIEGLINSFKEHVKNAQDYFGKITSLGNKEATELMQKAHQELKEAHKILVGIHKELKGMKINDKTEVNENE